VMVARRADAGEAGGVPPPPHPGDPPPHGIPDARGEAVGACAEGHSSPSRR
jgi:hypothetical protein